MNQKLLNIIIAGGSGQWSEKNHYPALLQLKEAGVAVRVVAICDPLDPYQDQRNESRVALKQILAMDKPAWVNTSEWSREAAAIEQNLTQLKDAYEVNALIIATNPVHHYHYALWALKNEVHVLCDKPLVVTPGSSYDLEAAQLIDTQFDDLLARYQTLVRKKPDYLFCLPLRRRSLTPFVKIAEGLTEVFQKTGEGIRFANIIANAGIHKFPAEYSQTGAHGHHDGIGSIAHKSYHYLDVIAWFLSVAPGAIDTIEVRPNYIIRLRDFVEAKGYSALLGLIDAQGRGTQEAAQLPDDMLNTELEYSFSFVLRDKQEHEIGAIIYTENYSSYAPREVPYDPEVIEYAHHPQGGRMSSLYLDVHQGALQQWKVVKNNIAALRDHDLELERRLHPKLGGVESEKTMYKDVYDSNVVTTKELAQYFMRGANGEKLANEQRGLLAEIGQQRFTNRIFSAMYQATAKDFAATHGGQPAPGRTIIKLADYL